MVAEDSSADMFLIQEALRAHALDFDLTAKRDGREMLDAINAIDQGDGPCPDLLLLDLNLPKHDGAAVLKRMRESVRCGSIPVIIVTSSAAARDRDQATRLGATAYFQKPSDFDEFMRLGELVKTVLP